MIKKSVYFTAKNNIINEKDVRKLISDLSPKQKECFFAYLHALNHSSFDAKFFR